jgi:hypothetical protein
MPVKAVTAMNFRKTGISNGKIRMAPAYNTNM